MPFAKQKKYPIYILIYLFAYLFQGYPALAQMQKLKIADNKHFIVKEDGTPFVWIGETNWFFAQLPPATIDSILDKRSSQGFNVMLVSCRNNLYNGKGPGDINNINEKWWSYLDDYIDKCEKRNLYVGITLGWWGMAMNSSEKYLYDYGKWVGLRYSKNNNIIWLTLGEAGSHNRKNTISPDKLTALIKGIKEGDAGNKLLTIHADYKRGTSITWESELCDFNNWQTSQWCCPIDLPRNDSRKWTVWEAIEFDYNKLYNGIPKPTIDLEAWYENNTDFCGATPFNIRRRAYYTIFAGACGHNYGAGGIWDGLNSGESCSKSALDALYYPGSQDMGYLSSFLHSFGDDFLKFRPDQSIILEGNSSNYDTHIQSISASDNSFLIVYSASDSPYIIDLRKLQGLSYSFIWYNPRSNKFQSIDNPARDRENKSQKFDPPGDIGVGNDWVLIVGNSQFWKRYKFN
jgi:hypothetical protein